MPSPENGVSGTMSFPMGFVINLVMAMGRVAQPCELSGEALWRDDFVCVATDAAAAQTFPMQMAAKHRTSSAIRVLRSPNCQSPYGLGWLPGRPVMLSSALIGHIETEYLEGTPCEA